MLKSSEMIKTYTIKVGRDLGESELSFLCNSFNKFPIFIEITAGPRRYRVDGKSILGLLSIAPFFQQGKEIMLTLDGLDDFYFTEIVSLVINVTNGKLR